MRERPDKRGISIHHVGTVAGKHYLYSRISADAERQIDARLVHMSDELLDMYFPSVVSEVYNPVKNRFDKKVKRNEPLDTWVYAYAATHHPEVRLHRFTKSDWDATDARLLSSIPVAADSRGTQGQGESNAVQDSRETARPAPVVRAHSSGFAHDGWGF